MTNLTKPKAAAERWLDDPDISLTLGGSTVACEEMQADLRRYLCALEARVASAEGPSDMSTDVQTKMDESAIEPFKDDLAAMAEYEIDSEYRSAVDLIEENERWVEAVCAWRRLKARAHFQSQGGAHGRD